MAQYTILAIQEVLDILAEYGISNLSSYKVLSGGSENTNYAVNTDDNKYVLTICEQKSEKKTRELTLLLEHLEAQDFATSKIIRTIKNEPIILWKDKPIMIKKFIEGKIEEDLSSHLLELIGKELGKLHKIKVPEYLPKQVSYGIEQFKKVEKYAADSPFDHWLKEKQNYLEPYLSLNLPKSIIHSDVFCDNVIISEDEKTVMIMDFEEAAHYYRVFDIGMSIIGLCSEEKKINLDKARHLLKGYQQEIQLLDTEINALQAFTVYAGTAMTFWRHMNFNYTKPDPKLTNHYLGLKVLADYMQGQSADCFVKPHL